MKNQNFNKLLASFIGILMIILGLIYVFTSNIALTQRIPGTFVILVFGAFVTLFALKSE